MSNTYFDFKQFRIEQSGAAMKVTTDGCMLGAWAARKIGGPALADDQIRILDIGTGTGLLSLMLAQQLPQTVSIQGIEIDPAAQQQAVTNVTASPWAGRIQVKLGDVRRLKGPALFDVIISNPPYYEKSLKGPKPAKNVAHHDEGLRLDELLSVIHRLLTPEGHFFLILPESRRGDLGDGLFLHDLQLTEEVRLRTTADKKPFRLLIHGQKSGNPVATAASSETIRGEDGEYSQWFRELLAPFYLAL